MTMVLHNQEEVLAVGAATIDQLKQLALTSPSRRARLCLHRANDELPHEMLIVFHRASFMPPHRHPRGKSESYHVVEGAMRVHLFDDAGQVIRTLRLGQGGEAFMYRLSGNLWHMPEALTEWLVYHEVYSGPFDKARDVEFPTWAPAESDSAGVTRFLHRLNLPS